MPDIGQPNPGQIGGGGGDWLERVKQFGQTIRSWGVLGKSEVTHAEKVGEGRLSQSMRSVSGRVTGKGSVTERESENVETQGSGRAARSLGEADVSVVKLGSNDKEGIYAKEMEVIGQMRERLQKEKISSSGVRQIITTVLNDTSLNMIDALNHLDREGKLDEVLDRLPISSVVFLATKDEELSAHIFGKSQPVTWDAFEERRWEASEEEGFGGTPAGGDEGEGGYLQRRIGDLDVHSMGAKERGEVENEFREINLILYEGFNR